MKTFQTKMAVLSVKIVGLAQRVVVDAAEYYAMAQCLNKRVSTYHVCMGRNFPKLPPCNALN